MSEPQNSVVVNIHGKHYTLALEPGETAEHLYQVAQLVEEHIRNIQQTHHPHSLLQTAILAALTLVDELFRLQTDYRATESDIAQRTSRLASSLGRIFEQVTAPDPGKS